MTWKYLNYVISWYVLYYYMYCAPVVSQNIISDYFFRINCSISDGAVSHTYNTIECASKCISDDLCEGFQAYKISSTVTLCALFNISSAIYVSNQNEKTYIKTELVYQFDKCNTIPETTHEGIVSIETTAHTMVQSYSSSYETTQETSLKATTVSTTTTISYTCSVDAAIYSISNGEIWLFFDKYIQIYTSVNDLTTSNFRREHLTDIFTDAPSKVDAGYSDGTNTMLVKDQMIYTYSSLIQSSSISTISLDSHFGLTMPQTDVDAIIVNGVGDIFLFSGDTVYRVESSSLSSFPIDNNGNQNYYKASNHAQRPTTVTAGTKMDSTTHYIFDGNQIYVFTEDNKSWANIGSILCNL
ncbi:uncharacterized protein LOC134713827 [Mytilus trossulus]|uniref:uncharacterized protein LOC134713827 n=1 Tax=Mytilus trossulus TaxID=6551 RepID=UPI0030064977